jgi:FtsP/CotA-like multicopper oxidase with cupredoxin domain
VPHWQPLSFGLMKSFGSKSEPAWSMTANILIPRACIHLHRHSFELTRLAGKTTSGILKDVVMLGGYQEAEIDFIADNPGLTLFHCHQQLHMDFGFMTLFDYV